MNKKILSTILISSVILIISLVMTGCGVGDVEETCSDEVQNQDETDVDCGGVCDSCEDGMACETGDDCVNKCSINKVCYKPATKTASSTSPSKQETTLSDETKALVVKKLKPNLMNAFAISQNFRSMDTGESYVFGLGLTNVYVRQFYFKIDLSLDKAVDSRSNRIEGVDPEYVNRWLEETTFVFPLTQSEIKIIPLKVKVGNEISDGIPTKPGSYTYNIKITYGDDPTLVEAIKEKYVTKHTLTIRVK